MKEDMGLKEMRQHRRIAVQQLSHSEKNLKKYRELGRRDSMVVYKVRMKALENYISLLDELIKKNNKEQGNMTKEQELLYESMELKEVILTITNDFVADVKKSIAECEIQLLEQRRYDDNIVLLRLSLPRGAYSLFQLGAFVQIARTIPPAAQPEIDSMFNLQ